MVVPGVIHQPVGLDLVLFKGSVIIVAKQTWQQSAFHVSCYFDAVVLDILCRVNGNTTRLLCVRIQSCPERGVNLARYT